MILVISVFVWYSYVNCNEDQVDPHYPCAARTPSYDSHRRSSWQKDRCPLFLSHAVGCGLCIVGEFRAESEDDRLFWKNQTQAIIDNVGADLKKRELTEALTAMVQITHTRLLEISK